MFINKSSYYPFLIMEEQKTPMICDLIADNFTLKPIDEIEAIIKSNVDTLNQTNSAKRTSLMIVCAVYDDVDVVELLIKYGADLELTDISGYNALMICILYNKINSFEYLIKHGAKINAETSMMKKNSSETNILKITPLSLALACKKEKAIPILIRYGAILNKFHYKNQTSLISTCHDNQTEMAKLLIDAGVDLDFLDNNGKSALDYSIERNNEELVKYLIESGAKFDNITVPPSMLKSYTKAIINLSERKAQKKMIFLFVLCEIPQRRTDMRYNPDNLGSKILKAHFELSSYGSESVYSRLDKKIIDYLGIIGESDMVKKISQYMIE